jgi:hypothetical protein
MRTKKRRVSHVKASFNLDPRTTHPNEDWWRDSWHLQKCMEFFLSPKFDLLLTYLEDPQVSRSRRSETLINV